MVAGITYMSFLVRLLREPEAYPADLADWQSEIEQIQSGQRWRFATSDEMFAFLSRQVADTGSLSTSPNVGGCSGDGTATSKRLT